MKNVVAKSHFPQSRGGNATLLNESSLQGRIQESGKVQDRRNTSFLLENEGKTISMTVLNVDIVNSSEKARPLSSEDAGEYYKIFIESTSDFIEHYGGYVLKNVGDCVIGFFPCRERLRSHDRAVLCGLEMCEMIKCALNPHYLNRKLPSIACRISADFGEARVLRVGSNGGYSAVDLFGNPLNSSSKISHYAKPNQMVIGDNLYSELRTIDYYDFRLVKRFDIIGSYDYQVYLVHKRSQAR